MSDTNFNILFEKIGHIEASQAGIQRSLERIEEHSFGFEKRLRRVENQTTRLITLSGICACLITLGVSILTKII